MRYLDSRIALLIANRMALDEVSRAWPAPENDQSFDRDRSRNLLFHPDVRAALQQSEVASTLEDTESVTGTALDDRKMQQYGNFFFLLQGEPRHIAALCRLVSLAEIDTLLQTVMFTLYGNQYESREEHLLLTMFQVSFSLTFACVDLKSGEKKLTSHHPMPQSVLSAQFETATEFGSLLRANTPVSRMMTTYTRRGPGQSFLKEVLAERINSLIEHKDLNLEVNPLKVSRPLPLRCSGCAAVGSHAFPDLRSMSR